MKSYKKKVKKNKVVKEQKVTTFEKLLNREPDELIKVKRNKVKKSDSAQCRPIELPVSS